MNLRHVEFRLMKWGVFGIETKKKREWILYRATGHDRVAEVYVDYEGDLVYNILVHPDVEHEFYDELEEALIAETKHWEHGG